MAKINKSFTFKGQLNSCPLFFNAIFFVILILLPACSKHKTSDALDSNLPVVALAGSMENINQPIFVKRTDFKTLANQAKNHDIATPVGYKVTKESTTENNNFSMYEGSMSLSAAINFYIKDLELSGWQFKNLSTKHEGLFVCNKPGKTCVVSIRPRGEYDSIICITTANDEMGYSL